MRQAVLTEEDFPISHPFYKVKSSLIASSLPSTYSLAWWMDFSDAFPEKSAAFIACLPAGLLQTL